MYFEKKNAFALHFADIIYIDENAIIICSYINIYSFLHFLFVNLDYLVFLGYFSRTRCAPFAEYDIRNWSVT